MEPAPPRLWCSPSIHLIAVGEDVVILDVEGDQYHCLPQAADDLRVGENGELMIEDAAIMLDLLALGLATERPPEVSRSPIQPASRNLHLVEAAPRLEVLGAGVALAASTVAYRGKSLAQLIAGKRAVTRDRAVDEDQLTTLVAAARAARPWIPFEGECLQRCFQLRDFLARRGISVDWIFGVRTWPFSAHCWLQTGDLIVGDRLERVGRYTPIMRV